MQLEYKWAKGYDSLRSKVFAAKLELSRIEKTLEPTKWTNADLKVKSLREDLRMYVEEEELRLYAESILATNTDSEGNLIYTTVTKRSN